MVSDLSIQMIPNLREIGKPCLMKRSLSDSTPSVIHKSDSPMSSYLVKADSPSKTQIAPDLFTPICLESTMHRICLLPLLSETTLTLIIKAHRGFDCHVLYLAVTGQKLLHTGSRHRERCLQCKPVQHGACRSGIFRQYPDGWVVLGDMKEGGDESLSAHRMIIDLLVASSLGRIYLVGSTFHKGMRNIWIQ